MRIEHVALWTADLERLRGFYVEVLGASAGPKYLNPRTGFESCFLSFREGARLELMRRADVAARGAGADAGGWAHVAFALGSREAVDEFAARLRARGLSIDSGPRQTGDGYYELAFRDPDGNRLEVVA
jgi:lactoylglutathione lyase